MRHLFCKEVLKKVEDNHIILFLDEHSFNLFQADKGCMWITPEKKKKVEGESNEEQFSLLTVFDISGGAYFKISSLFDEKYDDYKGFLNLIHQAIEGHEDSLNKTSDIFSEFSESSNKTVSINEKPLCLIMDPAVIRNKEKRRKYKEMAKGKIMFLPQFSSQLNPIEEWFYKLRESIRRSSYSTSFQLCQGVH